MPNVRLSHLREHKFRNNFLDSLNLNCNCGSAIKSTNHDFLHDRRDFRMTAEE